MVEDDKFKKKAKYFGIIIMSIAFYYFLKLIFG